jgi:hypothetical protein
MPRKTNRYAEADFDSRDHVIYKLLVPQTKIVRYVGQTWMRPSDRLDDHIMKAIHSIELPTSRLACWILALHNVARVAPDLDEIETVCGEDAVTREAYWIEHHRALGDPLLNGNSGGKPLAWSLPHLSFEERLARCADPDYDLKRR